MQIKKDERNEIKSTSHSRYRCQYHIVFAPKYRRKEIYGQLKKDIGEILRTLCKQKNVEISEIAPSHALQRANFVRQAPHRRCRSERAGGRQAGLDYPADDESRGRDRSHESGKSDVMGAVNELHPLPGRGNHQDGTNLLLREVKL